MSASRDPGGPMRPDSGSSDVSAAAERARERLHSEMEQVRVSINELLAEQDGAEESAFRNTFMERARGLSLAMLGIVTAVGLANPAHLAINQGLPLFGGGGGTPSTAAERPAANDGLIALAPPARARSAAAPAPRVSAGVGAGKTFITGHPDLGPQPVMIVGRLVPVGHTGTARRPPAQHGTPGPGGPPAATPIGTPAPAPAPGTIPAIEPEAGGGQNGPRGGGSGGGPVRAGTDSPGGGATGGDGDGGHDHGHGHGPPAGPGNSGGHGRPSSPGGSHGHGRPSSPGNSGSKGPPSDPGNSGGHGKGHGPPATAPPSTAPPSESAPPPPAHPGHESSSDDQTGYDGPGNGHGNGPPGGTPPGQARK